MTSKINEMESATACLRVVVATGIAAGQVSFTFGEESGELVWQRTFNHLAL